MNSKEHKYSKKQYEHMIIINYTNMFDNSYKIYSFIKNIRLLSKFTGGIRRDKDNV